MKQAPLSTEAGPRGIATDAAPPMLDSCSAAIDDGLLMVFGPEGDPLPPQAFHEAALARPEATVAIGGEAVPVARLAAVLQAQSRQRLAPPGGDGWLRAMLGLGPAPDAATPGELAWDGRVELIRFAHEVVLTTPAGQVLLLRAARPDDAEAGLEAIDATGAAMSHQALLDAVASDPSGYDQPVGGIVLPSDAADVVLSLPGGVVRLTQAGPETARSIPCMASGESVDWSAFAETLLCAPSGWQGLARAHDRPAQAGDPAGPEATLPAGPSLPEILAFDAQGFVDLDWLAGVPVPRGEQVTGILLQGLPPEVRVSAGRADGGAWRVGPDELAGLVMFATPEDLQSFTLEVQVEGPEGPPRWSIPVIPALGVENQVRPQEPLTVALDFPPPFSTRNRLDYFAVVMIEGLPPGATLSAGLPSTGSRWTLAPDDLRGLRVHLPAGVSLPCRLEVVGITVENREGMLSSARRALVIGADADDPQDDPPPAVAAVDLRPLLEAAGPDRRVDAVALSGLPPVVALSTGTHDRVSNCWVLRSNELTGVTMTVRDPALRRLSVKARAILTDGNGGASAISQALRVDIPAESSSGLEPVTRGPGFFRSLAERRA